MARIRTVKPEFWTSEQIMECSPLARLLFIGLWNFCDDRGVHPVAYKTLKAEVFPADDILSSDVERMVGELVSIGLLGVFEAEGRQWWYVTGWRHQIINRPSKSRYPEPPRCAPLPSAAGHGADSDDEIMDEFPISDQDSVIAHRGLMDDSMSPHCTLTDGVGVGVGVGGKPKPLSVVERSGQPPPLPPTTTEQRAPTRQGHVCGLLRKAGMADAAPHYLTDETWMAIFSKRSDEEIVELAKEKMAGRPGQRTGLKYIAPALLEDPPQIVMLPGARASPINGRRQASSSGRQAAIDNYAAEAAQARGDHCERSIGGERDITGESVRVS